MGCDYYPIEESGIVFAHFDEMSDSTACLCTFPHNDQDKLTIERIRSLAMLGAATVLYKRGLIRTEGGELVYLPSDLPDWFIQGLNTLLPEDANTWHPSEQEAPTENTEVLLCYHDFGSPKQWKHSVAAYEEGIYYLKEGMVFLPTEGMYWMYMTKPPVKKNRTLMEIFSEE